MPDLLIEMHTGVSGDMLLGALFDMGLNFRKWKEEMAKLGLDQVKVTRRKTRSQGLAATGITIKSGEKSKHRNLAAITRIIRQGRFSKDAESRAISIFSKLAEAEAKVHGCDIQSVVFHEVGGIDAIFDIVGSCVGFKMLEIDDFFTSPFTFGCGQIKGSHGMLPVPVPASLELAKGFPAIQTQIRSELCTPTGVAIITTLADHRISNLHYKIIKTGYGAGTRKLEGIPNVLRLSLIEKIKKPDDVLPDETVFQIECNLDDLSPEILGYVTLQLFETGCLDVWQQSIYMKKNRVGIKLCALAAREVLANALCIIAGETSTGGVRFFPVQRIVSRKSSKTLKIKYGRIQIKKIEFLDGAKKISHMTPEYESCKSISLRQKIPLQEVFREAISCLNQDRP